MSVYSLDRGGALARRANFFGIDDPNFRGGARAAVGDVNGDGDAGPGRRGRVRRRPAGGRCSTAGRDRRADPARLVGDFFAFPGTTPRCGTASFVAAGDVDGDGSGRPGFGGGPGGGPRVFVAERAAARRPPRADAASAAARWRTSSSGDAADRGGVRVAVKDADGDGRADVVAGQRGGAAGPGAGVPREDFAGGGEPAAFQDLDPFGAVLADGVFVG